MNWFGTLSVVDMRRSSGTSRGTARRVPSGSCRRRLGPPVVIAGTHCGPPDSFIRSMWSRSSFLLLKRATFVAIRLKSRRP